MNYTHLTQAERYQIAILNKAGHEQSEIARVMSRHPSTIGRELRRNRGQRGYRAKQAHEFSQARMRACENGPRIAAETWALVEERLGELWSPEQICGRLKELGLPAASHEAIYQRIYADQRNGRHPAPRPALSEGAQEALRGSRATRQHPQPGVDRAASGNRQPPRTLR